MRPPECLRIIGSRETVKVPISGGFRCFRRRFRDQSVELRALAPTNGASYQVVLASIIWAPEQAPGIHRNDDLLKPSRRNYELRREFRPTARSCWRCFGRAFNKCLLIKWKQKRQCLRKGDGRKLIKIFSALLLSQRPVYVLAKHLIR